MIMQANCIQCGSTIAIQSGHRPRRYCSNECRQTAYRRRHGKQARPSSEESQTEKAAKRIMAIKKQWPNFGFKTYFLLQQVQDKYGERFMTQIAKAIQWEITNALSNRNT